MTARRKTIYPLLADRLMYLCISYSDMARTIGMNPDTFRHKMAGRSEFTASEAIAIGD